MRHLSFISWFFLAGSIATFVFVVYQAGAIRATAEVQAIHAEDQEAQGDKSARAQRLSSIITETEDERAQLDAFAKLDVVAAVEMLEAAGKSAGIDVTVAGAHAESGTALATGELLQPITFAVNASGSYAALIHAVELYERLPLAVQIQQLDIVRDTGLGAGRNWNLSMRIRILVIATSL